MNDTIVNMIQAERLPAHYRDTVERHWLGLAAQIAALRVVKARPIIIGINGAQGTGKSTLCLFLDVLLAENYGLKAITLSLDDLYLTKADRASLAATIHPLFATRGVPGTHDLTLAAQTFAALRATSGSVALPRFDKSIDDRAAPTLWPHTPLPIDVVLFEGWCVGATPQRPEALSAPINALEAQEDPHCLWRAAVNQALADDYPALFETIDSLIMLEAPSFEAIQSWRQTQEAKLHAKTGCGMSDAGIIRFIAHYERLTRHMLGVMPAKANVVVKLGHDQRVIG